MKRRSERVCKVASSDGGLNSKFERRVSTEDGDGLVGVILAVDDGDVYSVVSRVIRRMSHFFR